MSAELWRPSLDLALHRNREHPDARLVQLATIGPDGRPAARTVVFRRFLDDPRALAFATDARDAKRAQLEADPRAEICWYFPITREQFRIAGLVALVGPDAADPALRRVRDEVWTALTDEARTRFAWPTPGEPRDPAACFPDAAPDRSTPLGNFLLMTLSAVAVDHLALEGDPRRRWIHEIDAQGRWTGREVNP